VAARQRQLDELAGALHARLVEDRRAQAAAGASPGDLAEEVQALVGRDAALLGPADREALATRIIRDTVGLGPLEDLLADPAVEEVMVNGPEQVFVERGGRIEPAGVSFAGEEDLRNAIERILAPLGRRIDELSPMVDARLADGSRVNVVIPPLAIDGPTVSIRRFGAQRPGPRELLRLGTLTETQYERLRAAVSGRRSVLVSGGTGSGKTTLLNALSSFVSTEERVVTIEDAAELRLQQPHVVRLESRPASIEGRGEVTIRDLLRNALRMRPDRIVIGEVRGPEALDLLTALNTGHDGALSTVHASSPEDAIRRLETLALMAGLGLPHESIAEQVRRGVDLVVHMERRPDGSRRVSEIQEVSG
jgi:pilus assembly protein CpaF